MKYDVATIFYGAADLKWLHFFPLIPYGRMWSRSFLYSQCAVVLRSVSHIQVFTGLSLCFPDWAGRKRHYPELSWKQSKKKKMKVWRGLWKFQVKTLKNETKKLESISDFQCLLIWSMWVRKTTYFVVWALLATCAKKQGPTQSALSFIPGWLTNSSTATTPVVLWHLTFGYWTFGIWTRDKKTPGLVLFAFLHKHLSHGDTEHMSKQVF